MSEDPALLARMRKDTLARVQEARDMMASLSRVQINNLVLELVMRTAKPGSTIDAWILTLATASIGMEYVRRLDNGSLFGDGN